MLHSKSTAHKIVAAALIALAALLIAVLAGSVSVHPSDALGLLFGKLTGRGAPDGLSPVIQSILLKIRLPRALMAFVVGAALAVSGTVMQSVLRNPLASSYTLGVSSGASLGAALVILTGFSQFGLFTLPLIGFVFGLGTVFAAISLTQHFDRTLTSNTVILVGMVLSLFVNAILTMVTALSQEHLQQLIFWQMGSFSGREYAQAGVVGAVVAACFLYLSRFSWEMDLMTFGEEQAMSAGVALKRTKLKLIAASALLTGASVAFTGTIGFVDLIAPHLVRRFFGPKHRLVVPMSGLFGGTLMVLSDLIARVVLAPRELPVGAVTALIGAPFFAYVYFSGRKKGDVC